MTHTTTSNDLLFHAALLAGLGPRAREVAQGLAGRAARDQADERTCVDAGGALMLSVAAPGGRGLRVTERLNDAAPKPGITRWQQTDHTDGAPQIVELFNRAPQAAWAHALDVARAAGCEALLRRRHALIGLRGQIFSVASAPNEPTLGTITWQLDRHSVPSDVLHACGLGAAWNQASGVLQELTGAPVFQRVGPWSIGWSLGEEGPRLRLGSSLWARTLETPSKARAMAAVVARLGGDGRFAEGLYKLLDSARTGHERIGRAVEIELHGAHVTAVEFYLHVPISRVTR